MDSRKKNILFTPILVSLMFLVCSGCKKPSPPDAVKIDGVTMGTTYHITYFDEQNRNFKTSVDSLLLVVNKSINTYDPASEVSQFNRSSKGIAVELPYLLPPLKTAYEVSVASGGAFDLTVMPLVNAWGFGPERRLNPDRKKVDSILTFVGFKKIQLTNDSVQKSDPKTQLDFGGIGQGYGADVVTDFLKSKGITDMLVELGGEGMACGKNLTSGKPWEIGILDPNSTYENQFFKAYIPLSDRSFTTAGNYFNYYEVDGVKYSHTISPETGFPVQQALLSASVFAEDCTIADAWDTAFMVMGHEKAIETLKAHPELDALLIYTNGSGKMETYVTEGIRSSVRIEPNQEQQHQ